MKRLPLGALLLSLPLNAFAADPKFIEHEYWQFWQSGAFSNFDIDGSSDKLEAIFVCPEACTIDAAGFLYGTRTGTTPQNRISIQGVNAADGRADGSIKNSGNAKQEFDPPNDTTWNSTFRWQTLDATYGCSAGETIAVVIEDDPGDAGTIDASNKSSYGYAHSGASGYTLPYHFRFDGTTATRSGAPAPIGVRCGSETYGFPLVTSTNGTFSSSSTPDERGNAVYLPSGSCSTAEICGAAGYLGLTNTSSDTEIDVYNGTVQVAEFVIDASLTGAVGNNFKVYFSTPYAMTCGDTDITLTFRPQSTNSITVGEATVEAQQDWNAYPGGSNVFARTRSDDTGAFTDVATKRYSIYPIFCDITAPAGGGGLKNHNQVSGGSQ